MKKSLQIVGRYISASGGLLLLSGCMSFPIVQAPGPKEHQVQASKEISIESVKAVAEAQKEKVTAMKEVAVPIAQAKVEAIKTVATESAKNTKDPEALTNINANAVAGIVRVGLEDKVLREIGTVDGTTKAVSGIAGRGIDSTETSTAQYLAYAGMQGAIGMQAYPQAIEQMKGVAKWGVDTLIPVIGGGLGGSGLIAGLLMALRKSALRRKLLKADGVVIEKQGSPDLKNALAKAHAGISADAKKEHGLI
ncbi:MAG TPA: hypothetical protein ACFYEA_10950 [Candidatus Tripitaka californicus]|uniref:hypothetical protein n=1 Tax=Candidatus Tripitaka californicus TaxID=3367616 RepID=UPI004026694B